ncbi:TRAP transporter substrate-binding protein DctP [Pollutimonas harenae]|nr:TRAP transporter substrate-binding protein DctP [Pollutimonas harenae]
MVRTFRTLMLVAGFTVACGATAAEKYELTLSTYLPPSYEYIYKPLESFAQRAEEKSQGRLKINIFHSGQLFDGYEELAALSRGDIDITNFSGSYAGGSIPALNIFTLPFLLNDMAHLRRAVDNGLLDLGIKEELASQHNAIILGVAPFDPYELYTRDSPVLKADDFKGKVWATTSATDARAVQLLGGSPTGMSSSELYLSFDRGVINATPRPLITGMGRSLYEVVKHLSLVNLAVDTSILTINKSKFDALPKDLQDILVESARERDADQFRRVGEYVKVALKTFEDKGMTIHRISPEAREDMKVKTSQAIKEWTEQVPNGEAYLKLIAETARPN